jgi:hypothetical protein
MLAIWRASEKKNMCFLRLSGPAGDAVARRQCCHWKTGVGPGPPAVAGCTPAPAAATFVAMPGARAPRTAPLPLHSPLRPYARPPRRYNEDPFYHLEGGRKYQVDAPQKARQAALSWMLLDPDSPVRYRQGLCIIYLFYDYTTASGRAEPAVISNAAFLPALPHYLGCVVGKEGTFVPSSALVRAGAALAVHCGCWLPGRAPFMRCAGAPSACSYSPLFSPPSAWLGSAGRVTLGSLRCLFRPGLFRRSSSRSSSSSSSSSRSSALQRGTRCGRHAGFVCQRACPTAAGARSWRPC